ncbi:MAG: hypothetical protein ACJ8AD_10095 [Gemmatimonadaceae bacterium]
MHTLPVQFGGFANRRMNCWLLVVLALVAISAMPRTLAAQGRVGSDSATRTTRYFRDMAYGTALGLAWAGVDQLRDDPEEWGKGWRGYGKRAASDVGQFLIQEAVTHALASAMDRPLDYQRCRCSHLSRRIGWALQAAVTDPMPNDTHPIAVPRIVGAYAGSFAQAAWRPDTEDRTRTALVNGTVSLLIGGAINIFYELRR